MYTIRVTKLVDSSKLATHTRNPNVCANKHPNHLRTIREMSYDSTVQYLPRTQKFLASVPFIPPTPNKRLEVNKPSMLGKFSPARGSVWQRTFLIACWQEAERRQKVV